MASVVKPKNQNVWNCRIKVWDAARQAYKWNCWSTGKLTEPEAMEVARAYQQAAEKLYPYAPGRDDKILLKQVFRSMCQRAGVHLDDLGEGPNFATFAADWLKRRNGKTKESTATSYAIAVQDFKDHLGDGGNVFMGSIDAKAMQAYYDSIIRDGRSTGTAHNKFSVIASIFKRAHELGEIKLNPCAPVETLPIVQEQRKPFNAEQENRIFEYLEETGNRDWLTACMLARWASLRLSDAANLDWSAVSQRDGHTILSYLPKKKTSRDGRGKLVVIPALGPLGEYLKKLEPKSGPLCPSLEMRAVGGTEGLSAAFAIILRHAGIDREKVDRGEGGADFYRLSFHSLRHGFVSWLTDQGVDLTTRKMLSDHNTDASHAAYTHPDAVKLAERLKHLAA